METINARAGDININDAMTPGTIYVVAENDRLKFARQVLTVLCSMIVAVFCAYAYWEKNEAIKQIFEFVKIGALPLITLIISFYFPNSVQKA